MYAAQLLRFCMWFLYVGRLEIEVVDIGPPADWVKINVQKTVRFQH